eukprot:6056427-Prymnesium_polylepis.1
MSFTSRGSGRLRMKAPSESLRSLMTSPTCVPLICGNCARATVVVRATHVARMADKEGAPHAICTASQVVVFTPAFGSFRIADWLILSSCIRFYKRLHK